MTKSSIILIVLSALMISCKGDTLKQVETPEKPLQVMDTSEFNAENSIEKLRKIQLAKEDYSEEEIQEINTLFDDMLIRAKEMDSIENMLKTRPKSILKACYEGTQNQASLVYREGGKFDLFWTGVFFGYGFYEGSYEIQSDTIFMTYSTSIPYRFGEVILKTETHLEVLDRPDSEGNTTVSFYLGECLQTN